MLLVALKHNGKWDFLGKIFRINGTTLESTVMHIVQIIADYVYNEVVDFCKTKYTISQMHRYAIKFHHIKHVVCYGCKVPASKPAVPES